MSFQERISERICEQGGVIEVSKISRQDRMLQSTREQFLDVRVPRLMEHLVDVPNMVSHDRIQRRTAEQIVDVPVPKVVEK